MGTVASEVAIARLIGKFQEVISAEAILPRKLKTRISESLNILKNMVYVPSSPDVGLLRADQLQICAPEVEDTDQLQICAREGEDTDQLLICAGEVEEIMDMFLVKALMTPKSWSGRIAAALLGGVQLALVPLRIRLPTRKLVKKVEELSQHIEKLQGIERSGNRTWQANLSDELAIVGREDAADRFVVHLTDSDWLSVVSVVGNEGMGKTALVRSVYNRLDIKQRFECQAWICNSNEPSLESVVVDVLKQSPVKALKDLELKEINDLGKLLHELLMDLRYLIVLDDLKSLDLLKNLLYFLPDSRNGSRVILTRREEAVPVPLPQEPWGFLLPVEQLDDENSRKLLRERSSINNCVLIEKILCKCNGSPMKILLFGGLTADFEPSDQDIRFLSFKSLPSWVKPCLLYLCLFPKESEISTRRIFQLWHAEGIVRWDQGHSTAEACFQKLVDRNLLQVVSRRDVDKTAKTCRLSGHLHDYFTKSCLTSVLPWVAPYSSNHTSPPLQDAETAWRISSYISFNTQKSGIWSTEVELLLKPLTASGHSMLLRVLDLEGVFKPKLPKQFGIMLPNLRYLGLRWTILDSLPESVSKLSRLETLDLKHTNVTKLPSSILRLKYVRHLYLNEVSFDNCKPTESCLSNIQTLWGLSIEVKSSVLCALGRLKRLRKLGLTCDAAVIPEVTKSISTMTMLQSLRLRSRDLFGHPSDLKTRKYMKNLKSLSKLYLLGGLNQESLHCFPKNLRVLTLSMSEMKSDPMEALGQLQHLIILRLFANSYKGETMVCQNGSFPSLQALRLWKLEKLKKITIHAGAIHSLEELDMRDCKILREIVGLKHASKLKLIKLTQVSEDFAKDVESTRPNPATMVTCRALKAPEDKEEAAKFEEEDDELYEEEEEEDGCSDNSEVNEVHESGKDGRWRRRWRYLPMCRK